MSTPVLQLKMGCVVSGVVRSLRSGSYSFLPTRPNLGVSGDVVTLLVLRIVSQKYHGAGLLFVQPRQAMRNHLGTHRARDRRKGATHRVGG